MTGIGFLYNDFIACIEKTEEGEYVFTWRHWDSDLPCNLPIIFWGHSAESLIYFLGIIECKILEEDKEKLCSTNCTPVKLTKNNDTLWIG